MNFSTYKIIFVLQIVEIVTNSGIYALKSEVAKAIKKSVSQSSLARLLLFAVFTREALENCAAKGNSTLNRPKLHEKGLLNIIGNIKQISSKKYYL